ncbi:PH domain-containing protein [Phytohabitans sp. ZYX-F-186]|uniref:PH domain-containing protein n=1 Tax=Phytohabitans maris TaxID=3071409 RepID=A0ABU0ZX94_9ACTN|nr:PH domain-containing protein [Phytohabitans sp. ZYX-F-186]MDQ7911466.1 PH domain-containing protein [Phytohabitans sp. ZYX-F-186]
MDALSWRVPRKVPAVKLAAAAALFAVGLLFADGDAVRLVLAAAVAAALALWAARDLLAPVRLAADPTGVTLVAGFAGRRHLAWSQIERVRVETRPRLGIRTETLEIDAGDSLHLFSEYDLGAPPAEVAAALKPLENR